MERNEEKIRKQKNSLNSGILIRLVLGLAAVVTMAHVFGWSFSALAGVYLGYKVLKLILQVLGLVISLLFKIVSIAVLIIIISLLIF